MALFDLQTASSKYFPSGSTAGPQMFNTNTAPPLAPRQQVSVSALNGRATQGTNAVANGGTTATASPAPPTPAPNTTQAYTNPTPVPNPPAPNVQPTAAQADALSGRADQGVAQAGQAGGSTVSTGVDAGGKPTGTTPFGYGNTAPKDGTGMSPGDINQYFKDVKGGAGADPNAFNPYGGPGTGEKWYAENGYKYGEPTQMAQYYQGIQGQIGGQRWQPTNMQGAYDTTSQGLKSQGAGTSTAMNAAGQLMGPSQGESAIYGANQYFNQPNQSSTYAQGQLASGYFGGNTDSTNYYNQNAAGLQGMGNSSAAAANIVGGLNYGDQALGMTSGAMNAAGNTQAYNAANQGNYNGTNVAGQAYGDFRPGLNEKSYSEQLYESGNEGLNTYYQRESDKRQKALEDKMAAMGVFGSGATGRAMYELQGELGAAQARDMAGLAGQADEAYRGRGALSGQLAGQAGQESVSRLGLGLESAKASDQGLRDNTKLMQDAYGMASDEDLARANTMLGVEDRTTARTKLGGDLAAQSDSTGLARRTAGSDIATAGDTSRINQGRAITDMGQAAGQLSNQRLSTAGTLGLGADAENRSRIDDYFNQSKGLDEANLASKNFTIDNQLKELGVNRELDTQTLDRLNDQFGAAKDNQGLYQGRYDKAFDQSRLLANDQAKLISGGTELATTEAGNYSNEDISLLMDSAGLTTEEAQQYAELATKTGVSVTQMAQFINELRKNGGQPGAGKTADPDPYGGIGR